MAEKVHVWEIQCADESCRKFFHLLTRHDAEPEEELMCVECQSNHHRRGVLYASVERKDKNRVNLHTGYTLQSMERIQRVKVIGNDSEQNSQGDETNV